jgi:hypothetical protein
MRKDLILAQSVTGHFGKGKIWFTDQYIDTWNPFIILFLSHFLPSLFPILIFFP